MNKKFTLSIACDNAAFGENEHDCRDEVIRILRVTVQHLTHAIDRSALRDDNGNVVGSYALEDSQ